MPLARWRMGILDAWARREKSLVPTLRLDRAGDRSSARRPWPPTAPGLHAHTTHLRYRHTNIRSRVLSCIMTATPRPGPSLPPCSAWAALQPAPTSRCRHEHHLDDGTWSLPDDRISIDHDPWQSPSTMLGWAHPHRSESSSAGVEECLSRRRTPKTMASQASWGLFSWRSACERARAGLSVLLHEPTLDPRMDARIQTADGWVGGLDAMVVLIH